MISLGERKMGLRRTNITVEAYILVLLLMMFLSLFQLQGLKVEGGGGQGLSYGYYEEKCPQVEDIVRDAFQSLSLTDPTSSSALLRLLFHDCQVQGCDASILVDPDYETTTEPMEMASSKNFGIRKRETIGLIKSMVEAVCPRQVSCADILVLAARDAVAMSGGPHIMIPLGRRDSTTTPSRKLADKLLPQATVGVDGTIRLFAGKGMTIEETVAIIGAHTLGMTHCFNVLSRLSRPDADVADDMAPGFEMLLRLSCPLGSLTPNTTFVVNDPTTLIFDNQYYINSIGGRGILRVDSELPSDPRTAPLIKVSSFGVLKVSSFGVLTGNQGIIREKCHSLS